LLQISPVLSQSASLLEVLRREGFTEFASLLEGPSGADILNAGPNLIVYAPTNAAFLEDDIFGLTRRTTDDAQAKIQVADGTSDSGDKQKRAKSTCTADPGSEVFVTLLDDPEFVNLGPGQNARIVQKNVPNAALPTVLTGRGATVKVTGLDIPYNNGVIRPVSGVFTLPYLLSETLPFLGADKTLAALQSTGLLAELNNRTSITFLAPDDTVINGLSDTELVNVLRQHVILGLPVYTPLIVDGAVYTTLAGTNVTASVRGPDFFIGGARILAGDTIIKNGVVHTADRV
ncbi:FAS1 domain-containing protein, partial [Lasiosphaeris hirsuta]